MIQYVKPTSTIYVLEAAFINNIAFIEFYLKYNGDINVLDKENKNGIISFIKPHIMLLWVITLMF